jgi:trehalose-6-phosphate synthase
VERLLRDEPRLRQEGRRDLSSRRSCTRPLTAELESKSAEESGFRQVWIHDYHLLLVPKMLRELLPEASPYISLFLHCPFPSSEYFRNLPRKLSSSSFTPRLPLNASRKPGREAILDGMLGCNLVCFQTHSYARHFLSSCVRVMGYEAGSGGVDAKGSITRIAHCPIGIDVENVELDRCVRRERDPHGTG